MFRSSSVYRGLIKAHRIILCFIPTSVGFRFMKVSALPTSPVPWQPSDPSASGPKPVPSLRAALYHTAGSALSQCWCGRCLLDHLVRAAKSRTFGICKSQWVEFELFSYVRPHSAAQQLPSWPSLLIFPTHLPALTSPSNPVSVTYLWHELPNPVQSLPLTLPQQMQTESAELELKHMLKYTD